MLPPRSKILAETISKIIRRRKREEKKTRENRYQNISQKDKQELRERKQ